MTSEEAAGELSRRVRIRIIIVQAIGNVQTGRWGLRARTNADHRG